MDWRGNIMKKYPTIPLLLALLLCLAALPAHAGRITYTYDTNARLTKADYGAETSIAYTYDEGGNLTRRQTAGEGGTHVLTTAASPADRGGVAKDPDQAAYDHGAQVQLTATANAGSLFLGWSGDLGGTDTPATITMNANKTVTGYFGDESGDTSGNGLSDETQMGPDGDDPSYDGNGNGVPDYQEARAASLPTASGGGYATLAVPDGQALKNVEAVTPPAGAPEGVQFPNGLFSFKINGLDSAGDCTTATLYLARNTAINTYYKYGRTADNPTDHWYEFLDNGRTGATITHTATQTVITLKLCDGERGDHDLTANEEITDPGGPGIRQGDPTAIPTLSEWGLILMSVLMLITGLIMHRRRKQGLM
jgi:hypothetical protein